MNVVVLFSGGIDSTVCTAMYKARDDNVECLIVDYGQPQWESELKAAIDLSAYYGVKLSQIKIEGTKIHPGMIPGRNALLVCLALLKIDFPQGGIALGIHDGTPYQDCTQNFVNDIQKIVNLYFNGKIEVLAPFVSWSKSEIADYGLKLKVPYNRVFSSNWKKDQMTGLYI